MRQEGSPIGRFGRKAASLTHFLLFFLRCDHPIDRYAHHRRTRTRSTPAGGREIVNEQNDDPILNSKSFRTKRNVLWYFFTENHE